MMGGLARTRLGPPFCVHIQVGLLCDTCHNLPLSDTRGVGRAEHRRSRTTTFSVTFMLRSS